MSLLSVDGVRLAFGGVLALDNISLELNRGEILGLIGPNGAGKTTLFNCISGVLRPDAGTISFNGKSIMALPPHERARLGIARTFQDLQLWGSMTVLENCKLPMDALGRRGIVSDALRLPNALHAEKSADERALAVLHALDLLPYADRLAGDLSVGLQRRVELARAICMRPKLILLDEPASGLDAEETLELADRLARIRDRFKVSMLLVDHDMSLVMRACHFIYVLDFGELIAAGRPEVVRNDKRVIAAYLGESKAEEKVEEKEETPAKRAPARVSPRRAAGGDLVEELRGVYRGWNELLEVKGLHAGYGGIEVIRNVNLKVGEGEVVACIGANGAGKTTTLRAISGLIKPTKGSITFQGHEIAGKAPQSIVHLGLSHIPQGRGLFPKLTVAETLSLATYGGEAGDEDLVFETFPVLKDRLHQLVGTLSGGQQQMVALARALIVKPKLLLLDEMSQGLAPALVQQLFERIEVFRRESISVFLVEQFVDSALAIADRAYVFEQGTVAHESRADVLRKDQAVIAGSYLGTAVDVEGPVEVMEERVPTPAFLEDLQVRLPAEIKRALEERADREGRATDDLVLELLGSGSKNGGAK